MASIKRLKLIRRKILETKEGLLNRIAKHFDIQVPIYLVRPEVVFLGAQGCFEGDQIKINCDLPLFWQLIILEHEMGHYLTTSGNGKEGIIYHCFKTHPMSTSERRAWEWVDENPISRGGVIDKEVRQYIKDLHVVGKKYGHLDEVIRLGWWY